MAAPRSPPRSVPTTPPTTSTDDAVQAQFEDVPPHNSIAYSAAFTNALSAHVLTAASSASQSARSCIRIVPPHLPDQTSLSQPSALRERSLPLSALDITSLPKIRQGELPLPLDDVRRMYTSAVPGILLTHPGGYIEGGPSTNTLERTPITALGSSALESSAMDAMAGVEITTGLDDRIDNQNHMDLDTQPTSPPRTTTDPSTPAFTNTHPTDSISPLPSSAYTAFVRTFLSRHPTITTQTDLQRAIAAETETQLEALRTRMREREEAARRNGEVEKKIGELVSEREVERKVVERWKEKRRGGQGAKGMEGEAAVANG